MPALTGWPFLACLLHCIDAKQPAYGGGKRVWLNWSLTIWRHWQCNLTNASLQHWMSQASNLPNGSLRHSPPHVGPFKVGLELLTAEGAPAVCHALHKLGAEVFADMKFLDIPNTVGAAAQAIASQGVAMFNVHASGGIEMMRAAVANKGNSLVLAVTVLTSMDESACRRSYGASPAEKVLQFALDAKEAGADGIICSSQELHVLKPLSELSGMFFVTPGIRPVWAVVGDQKRITTPAEAIRAGADYLVIGRPILKPPAEIGSPVEAAKRIADEIAEALAE